MNKNRYQQIMNRIQMPERCEQAILEQIAHNASPVPTRRTWKRNVIAGVAIAACISVIGMVSVSAIQEQTGFISCSRTAAMMQQRHNMHRNKPEMFLLFPLIWTIWTQN